MKRVAITLLTVTLGACTTSSSPVSPSTSSSSTASPYVYPSTVPVAYTNEGPNTQGLPSAPTPTADQQLCATNPPYGGNDGNAPTGGCYTGRTLGEIETAIGTLTQGALGRSGLAYAYPQMLPDASWIIAVYLPPGR